MFQLVLRKQSIGFSRLNYFNIQMSVRRAILVFGSGRSGTSLLMQVLASLGMRLSMNLIGPHYENQDGFFEDAQIIELHKSLLLDIGSMPLLPLPDGWIESPLLSTYRSKIAALVEENVSLSVDAVWGLKDPRLSSLLPLWIPIFKSLWVVPSFVLAVRRPEDVVISLTRQAKISPELAELVWLNRTCDALHNSSANCFVVHYEDWFSDPMPVAKDLMTYLSLDPESKLDLSGALDGVIKSRLNRASLDDYRVANPLVSKLYAALIKCRGSNFDRAELMVTVKQCRQAMHCYKGWYDLANDSNKKLAESKGKLEKANADIAKLKSLETRIRELEREKLQSEQLSQQVLKLQWQLDHFSSLG